MSILSWIKSNIRVSFVYVTFPTIIFYYDFSGKFAGKAIGPLIFIKNKYRADKGLLAHEKDHVKQAYVGLWLIHGVLYKFVKRYRYWAEIRAYRVQLRYIPPNDLVRLSNKFAHFIVNRYKLGSYVTFAKSVNDLTG